MSRQALEAVSSCKGVLNRLIARVQRIRQELENIMSDDVDMQVGSMLSTWFVDKQIGWLGLWQRQHSNQQSVGKRA